MSVPNAECRSIAAEVVQRVPTGRPASAILQAYCAVDACPAGFAARPTGSASIELDDGTIRIFPVQVAGGRLIVGEGLTQPAAALGARSTRTGSGGDYELGHCGLFSPIDIDGSLWDPIGEIDGDAPAAVNAMRGRIELTGAGTARFVADDGFQVELERRDGPKASPLCA